MRTACRRFDLYRIGMEDVERCGAWSSGEAVSFTHADSLGFQRVRKRNTSFFDALTDVCGLPYAVSEGVLTDLLYEAVVVDLSQAKDSSCVRCLQEDGSAAILRPAQELQRLVFRSGFRITEIPGRAEPVTFVPFVASASMSREGEYLFINRERLDAALRAVSLDMVCGSGEYVPVISGCPAQGMTGVTHVGLREKEKHISPPKLAAYLGLSLSDGVSVRELLTARACRRELADMAELPEVEALLAGSAGLPRAEAVDKSAWLLGLNEHNTICVSDCDSFDMGLSAFNACWVNSEIPVEARVLPLPEKYRRKEALPEPCELAEVFGTLAALAGGDEKQKKQAGERFEQLLSAPDSPVWAQWRHAAADFFVTPGMLDLPRGPIPLPGSAAEAQANLNTLAFLYAAAPSLTNGRRELRQRAEKEQRGVIGLPQLLRTIEGFRSSAKARRQLWRLLAQRQASRCRMISAETVPGGIRVEAGTPEKIRYRAELRHISPRSSVTRGRLSDGCGFMEPVLFDRLERLLRGRERREDEEPINAVQVRLPWCKGLLVRFSFSAWLRELAQAQGVEAAGLVMRDVYGCDRPLFDDMGRARIRVLFTDSMFKGVNWFRRLTGEQDRWALYWERLRAHGASILIAGKSTPAGMESRLNYQFLSTIGMRAEEAWELADKRLKLLAKARTDESALAGLFSGGQEAAEDGTDALSDGPVETLWDEEPELPEDEEDEPPEDDAYAALAPRLLRRYPALMKRTAWVGSRYNGLVESEVLQLMRGRLPVEGDVRYVLPDLLEMIRCIARDFVRLPDGKPLGVPEGASAINRCDPDAPQGRYYAPGRQVPWTWRKEERRGEPMEVAILRNPHYASGEEPILSPLPPEDMKAYNRWFSGLTGCVMVPCAALMTLNGADSDGDRVNVCAQQSVIRAIRRRAAQTNQLLEQVVRRRGEMTGWLRERAEKATRRESAAYLTLLAAELEQILPGSLQAQKQDRKYSPPLLYAGSDAKGTRYSPEEMQGVHLRDRLWDCFCLSRQQEIGRMSLDMLDRAADAYNETDERFTKETPVQRLLAAFMTRYLAVSDALDTALEIDMAKTGMSHGRTALRSPDADTRELLGMGRGCRFRVWRTLYLRYRAALSGSDFSRRLEEMMAEYAGQAADGAEHALMLDGLPEMIGRMWRGCRKELTLNGHGRLHALLVPPACQPSERLLARAQELALDYDRKRRCLRSAAYGERSVTRCRQDMLRWLLGSGFALDAAVEAMETLTAMLRRWQEELPEDFGGMLSRLERLAGETENAAAWGWANASGRDMLLRGLLTAAAQAEGTACPVSLTKEETALLTCSSRSIQLLRYAAAYGRGRDSIDRRAGIADNATPDQLEKELWEVAGGRREMYYALCWHLSGTTWQRGKRSCYYLGDFLTAYLLRDMLIHRISTQEQGGRT